jgi:hypothetical protein
LKALPEMWTMKLFFGWTAFSLLCLIWLLSLPITSFLVFATVTGYQMFLAPGHASEVHRIFAFCLILLWLIVPPVFSFAVFRRTKIASLA